MGVTELEDVSDLESDVFVHKGSSPFSRINLILCQSGGIGRHMGLKIPGYICTVLVRIKSLVYFFYYHLKERLNMYYVIPDVHGQYNKLNKLLNKIIDHKKTW